MAGSSEKQGAKVDATKAKSVAKKSGAKKTVKKTVKPASFSKDAMIKKTVKKDSGFEEFETLKLDTTIKSSPKIIIRDVAKDNLPTKKVVKTPKTSPAPQPISRPVSRPKPVAQPKLSAKEIKEQEIKKAISNATKLPEATTRRKKYFFSEFGWKRAVLATACLTTAVFAIVYFVNLASNDISLKSAAAQSGIDAKYPSYVPRDYELSDITSSSGKVLMRFKNDSNEFQLSEEDSNWDSDALLNDYVKPTYANDYTVIREQGLTLYMGTSWEAWVNGGVLYKLTVTSGTLTKKQMKTIATSL